MPDANESPKIAFAPNLDVHAVDDRRVLLVSEERTFLLTGKLYVAITPYLDGSRTRDEIVAAMRAETTAPLDRIELAMSTLLERKYVTPVAPGVPAARAAFWIELKADPASAERGIRETRVALRSLGRTPAHAERLAPMLADMGFSLVADGDTAHLTVVVVEDYLDPRLESINRAMRQAGRRWLLLKPPGHVAWVGPIFQPDGPCWACLAKRLRENRPQELTTGAGDTLPRPPRSELPASRGLALNLAALELARAVAGVADAGLTANRLLTLDLKSLAVTRHVVHGQPACPACGTERAMPGEITPVRLEARRKHPMVDGGSRAYPPEEVLARLEPHVSPLTGLIAGLANFSPTEGLPVYGTRQISPVAVGPRQNRLVGRAQHAVGKGMTEIQAKVSCLAEAVERYSTGWQGVEPRRRATLAEMGAEAVHPDVLMNYSARQYAGRATWNASNSGFHHVAVPFEPERAIDWTPVWSVSRDRARWIPTQFCYYNYPGDPDYEFYRAESNGCASGSTIEEAVLQGFMELVERDSCALWWYNRVRRPAIDLGSFGDPFFSRTEAFLRTRGRNLYALDLTSDLGIPVVVALSHDVAGGRIMCGLGAHLDARVAASRAVAELNQMLAVELTAQPASPAISDDQSLGRWMREATIENQPYVSPAGSPLSAGDYPPLETDDLLGDIKHCLGAVERCGLEMLVLDTTRAEVGFPAARVTVPGLRHFWARLGPGRLYDVPVALGWLERPLDESELNPIPFFL